MTVMETEKKTREDDVERSEEKNVGPSNGNADDVKKAADKNIFSESNISKDEVVGNPDGESDAGRDAALTITSKDKVAFIDSIVSNSRFTKDYSLFGGKFKLTLRSLTTDEVNAMSYWAASEGAADVTGIMTGRYRKHLATAQVERMNGVQMPALEEPLFVTIGTDGKKIPPKWVSRSSYWDNVPSGLFDAIIRTIKEFDGLYSTLCGKAEDSNFWDPDTP